MSAQVGAKTRRRPADRRGLILKAASQLFCEKGFHNVTVSDVAGELDITATSLYRHFRNKQDLLYSAVEACIDTVDDLVAGSATLSQWLTRAAAGTVTDRTSATLWQREARHLPEADRDRLRDKLIGAARRGSDLIAADRPDLDPEDAQLLAWAVMSVYASVSNHRVSLPRRRFEQVLTALAAGAVASPLGRVAPGSSAAAAPREAVASSTRERLLVEAVRLFDERGFQSVGTEQIGEQIGTSGPNIYKYFPSKTDLLLAAVVRAGESRRLVTAEALGHDGDARATLDRLVRSYVTFGVENRHLLGVLISELDQLPESGRRAARQEQRDYIALWVRVLTNVRPDLDVATARITVHAAWSVVDNITRTGHVGARGDLADRLAEICAAVLAAPPAGA